MCVWVCVCVSRCAVMDLCHVVHWSLLFIGRHNNAAVILLLSPGILVRAGPACRCNVWTDGRTRWGLCCLRSHKTRVCL